MPGRRFVSRWGTIAILAAFMALSWVGTALAQADSGGDGFDGDELGLPIILGAVVLVVVGWSVIRGRSRKSP